MSAPEHRRESDPLREIEDSEARLAALLRSERPAPPPAFRGELRRRLASADRGRRGSRLLGSLRAQIAGCLSAGLVLLAVAAAGLVGAGPFSV